MPLQLIGSLIACLGAASITRSYLVYRERMRWLDQYPIPHVDDPDFEDKMERVQWNLGLCRVVSYDEMMLKFWIPASRFKEIAQWRLLNQKYKGLGEKLEREPRP